MCKSSWAVKSGHVCALHAEALAKTGWLEKMWMGQETFLYCLHHIGLETRLYLLAEREEVIIIYFALSYLKILDDCNYRGKCVCNVGVAPFLVLLILMQ